jgi:hypothetical protein
LAWLAALASLCAAGASARSLRAALDALPTPEWRGAPLRAPLRAEATVEETAPAPVEQIDGAFALDLARLTFDDYDAPELRLDPRPLEPAA